MRKTPTPAKRVQASREDAERDCRAVTHFLALGFPAQVTQGSNRQRSAVRLAADLVGADRVLFAKRVGAPDCPGFYLRKFGVRPDWSAGETARAARGELGTAPVLPGYVLKSVATQRDAEGNTEREWLQQVRAPAPPSPLPAGHVLKGVSRLVDGQGNILAEWQKTREGADPTDVLAAFRAAMMDLPRAATIPAPVLVDDDLLTVYPLPDLHLGMLAWARETGDAYDLDIAVARAREMVGELIAQARPSRTAIILGLGDYFHQNDQTNRTPRSGHVLDVDSRWPKIYKAGIRLAMDLIEMAAERHERVLARFLPGNHDPDATQTMTAGLSIHYESNARITVDDDPSHHFYHRHGRVLIGATHGHTMTPERMALMLASDRVEDWGAARYRSFFFGHVHRESAREVGPVRVESFNTIASKDGYAHAGGFRSGQALNAITYHRTRGEVGRHRIEVGSLDRETAA